jgi:hypothetical protein
MTKEELTSSMVDAEWSKIGPLKFMKTLGGKNSPRNIFLIFEQIGEGYKIRHPSYTYHNTNSHFMAKEEDKRLTLNKVFLIHIINGLKQCGVWKHIVNQDFLAVNTFNKKIDKAYLKSELKAIQM